MTDFKYHAYSDLTNFLLNILSYLYVGIKAVAGAISIGDVTKFSGAAAQFGFSVFGMVDAASQRSCLNPLASA